MKHITIIIFLQIACLLSCSKERSFKTVIIGGGLMGSSAAWQIAKEGKEILLIEKQDDSYQEGSSQGKSRIARSLGPENDIWSYMHNTTVQEAEELIEYLNKHDSEAHAMEDIYSTTPMNYVRHRKQMERIHSSLINQKDSFQFAQNPIEAKQLFDMNITDTTIVLREYKKHTGTINPYSLIKKTHKALEILNNQIWYNSKVTSLKQVDDRYEILVSRQGKTETILADRIICAAGPYNGMLLENIAPYVKSLINPQRVFLAFFKINDEVYKSLSNNDKQNIKNGYPAINSSAGTREGNFFTMVEEYDKANNPIIKIGGHFQRSDISNLDEVWKKTISESEIDWSKQNTLTHLNQLNINIKSTDLEFVKGYSCVYSLTKNEIPIISHLIHESGEKINSAIMMGGLSGVGGKGSLGYGKLAADLFFNRADNNPTYSAVVNKMGLKRLQNDVKDLD